MAKFAIVVDDWMTSLGLTATAIQCWSSMQKNYGVNVCTVMSMMSEQMLPSACEVDIAGVVSMYALQLASGKPSALVDWNNNYGSRSGQVRLLSLRKLGQRIFFPISASGQPRSSAQCWAKKTRWERWKDGRLRAQ